jgi:uridine kinase
MKIAIYCSGYLRTFKTNYVQLKSILDQYECDLFMYVIYNEYDCDHYINPKQNLKDVIEQYNPKLFLTEASKTSENVDERIKQMWFKIYCLNNMRKLIEARDNIKYTHIIRWRPDIFIGEITNLDLSMNCIFLPSSDTISYPENRSDNLDGCNDQFAFGPVELMNLYSNLYDHIEKYNKRNIFNSSSLLKHHLETNNIAYKEVLNGIRCIQKENILITICGDSGSGKTTLANKMKDVFITFGKDCIVYECDRYHKWNRYDGNWKEFTHLHPEANYLMVMKDDIFKLKNNLHIEQVDYDHSSGYFTCKEPIHPASVIIVCGLHTLFDENLNRISNLKIFLEPEESLKINWKLQRDEKERGHTKEQVIQSMLKRKKDREAFIDPQKNNSDMIIQVLEDKMNIITSKETLTEFDMMQLCMKIIEKLEFK